MVYSWLPWTERCVRYALLSGTCLILLSSLLFFCRKDTNTCHEQGQTSDLYPGPEVMEQLLNPPVVIGITWPGFSRSTRTTEAQFLGMLLEKIYFQQVTAHSGDCRV